MDSAMEPSHHLIRHDGIVTSNFSSNRTGMSKLVTTTATDCLDYKDYASFKTSIQSLLDSDCHFVEFTNVSAEDFEFLASDKKRILKSARFGYDFLTKRLMIKMPRMEHAELTGLFRGLVDEQLVSMRVSRELVALPSPLARLGNWAKEPDVAWSPDSTGHITAVLEVADSAFARQLADDARGWVETSGTKVEACVTIALGETNSLTIEVWRRGRRTDELSTGNQTSPAIVVQHVEILNREEGRQIRGWKIDQNTDAMSPTDEIRLDFAMLVGRRATTDLEQDVVIDRNLLIKFANRFWLRQRQRLQGQ